MASQPSAWKRFWDNGGFWRALLLAAVYLGVYELIGFVLGQIDEDVRGAEGSASYVFFATALPIILTSVLLIVFAASVGC